MREKIFVNRSLSSRAFKTLVNDFISLISNQFQAFLLAALIVRFDSASAFAIWALASQALSYLNVLEIRNVAQLRISLGTAQHEADFSYKRRQVGAAVLSWFISVPLLLIISFLLFHFSVDLLIHNPIDKPVFKNVLIVLILTAILERLFSIPGTIIRAINLEYRVFSINLLIALINISFSSAAIFFGYGIFGLAIAMLMSLTFSSLIKFRFAFKEIEWFGIERPNREDLKRYLQSSIWYSLLSLGNALIMSSAILIAGILFSTEKVAFFASCLMLVKIPSIPSWRILDASDSGLANILGEGVKERIESLRSEIRKITTLVYALFGMIIIPFSHWILKAWVRIESEYTLMTTLLLYVAFGCYSLCRVDLSLLANMRKERLLSVYVIFCGILGTILSHVFGVNFGYIGLATGLIVSMYILQTLTMSSVLNYGKCSSFLIVSKEIAPIVYVFFASILINYLASLFSNFTIINFLFGIFLVLVSCVILTCIFFDKEFLAGLKQRYQSIKY